MLSWLDRSHTFTADIISTRILKACVADFIPIGARLGRGAIEFRSYELISNRRVWQINFSGFDSSGTYFSLTEVGLQ